MKPIIANDRIDVIDLIRGFALAGLPFINVLALWQSNIQLSGEKMDVWLQRLLYIFVEGRFYAIFSFLFGLGLWIFLTRAQKNKDRPSLLFVRRMLILFVVGMLHQLINPGEALMIYAILGLPVIFLIKVPRLVNVSIGIVGVLVGSILGTKMLLVIPLIILGVACGQYRLFESYKENKKKWRLAFVVSFIAMCSATIYLWQQAPTDGLLHYTDGTPLSVQQIESNVDFYAFAKIAFTLAPIFTVFYVTFVVLVEGKWLTPLQAYGKMAFTNYIGQSVLLVLIAQLLLGEMNVSYLAATVACAVVVCIQIIFSALWLKVFKYGPLEWLWRCGTYWQWLPIRK